ncbi:MAG: SDR family oxidoreductase [Actinomycetota bacterium]|nr:SDR family oxidoreductase [Actinomycetota bacterium]
MTRSHEDKVAVVTGAGQGIGQAYARRLAENGANVVVVDVEEPTETVALVAETGARGVAHVGDVSVPETAEAVAATVKEEFGCCDILVNNAGIYPMAPFEDLDFAFWRRMFAVNLDSMFLFCQALVPGMRERGWGRVVNMTSNTVGLNITHCVPYIASKAGVIGFTRGLASEVGVDGVTVNAIGPSLVQTPTTMNREAGPGGLSPADEATFIAGLQAVKRPETPSDLVGTMAFLTSDDAGFITAQTIFVDGGLVRA